MLKKQPRRFLGITWSHSAHPGWSKFLYALISLVESVLMVATFGIVAADWRLRYARWYAMKPIRALKKAKKQRLPEK